MSLKTINLKIMETKEQKENDYRKFRLTYRSYAQLGS